MSQRVSIVIPTYKRKEKLDRLLSSIEKSKHEFISVDVIVVVDADGENYSEMMKSHPSVKFIMNDKEMFASETRNIGAALAKGELIYFIDDDNVIDPNCIEIIARVFDEHSDVGLAGPVMLFKERPDTIWCAGGVLNRPFFTHRHLYFGNNISVLTASAFIECDYLPNFYVVRRDVFDKIGGMDSKEFPIALEEVDLALRIASLGQRIITVPSSFTYHDIPFGPDVHMGGKRAYHRGRSRVRFYKKYSPLRALFIPIDSIVFMMSIIRREPHGCGKDISNYLKGILDGVVGYESWLIKK